MGVPIQVWRARIGGFSPNRKASRSAKFRASHGRTTFRGGPLVTICLLCACALLLLASGIEPNPGPDTPRVPTPCDEPLVTPHRRATTKSTSDDAGAANTVICMQCNRTTPDQPTITCSICNESIHLGCLKVGKYLECQGWRKEPPQYIGQLFNSPHFKFLCHSCVSKPSPIIQDDITVTMRSIEHKLDILTSSVIGATTDTNTDTTTSRQKPSFAETTAKAVVRQIEQSHRLPQQTTHPSPSPSGIANEVWRHIEKRQTETREADDHKRSVIVLGAPFDESKTRIERNRVDTTFVRHLASTLGIDPMQVQRVHRFAKHPGNERPPVLKVTFMTEAAQDAALSEKSCLRDETDLANVYLRLSHPKSTRDHRNVLFYAASHETFDPDKTVKCVYSSYSETFELRYIIDGRVDWNTAIPFSDATYATWKAAVAGRRRSASVARPGNVVTRATVTDE